MAPARSPPVGDSRGVGVHRPLHVGPVVVLLGVVLGAGVVAVGAAAEQGVLEPQPPLCSVGARGGVDAVLVDIAELVVHGVADGAVALPRRLRRAEVAGGEDGSVGAVGDHRMSPPVGDGAETVVVVVRHRIAYLLIVTSHNNN